MRKISALVAFLRGLAIILLKSTQYIYFTTYALIYIQIKNLKIKQINFYYQLFYFFLFY